METLTCVEDAQDFREDLLDLELKLRKSIADLKWSEQAIHDKWECIAHAMLALRHIEDARMRMWKVIQYATSWVSNYDK